MTGVVSIPSRAGFLAARASGIKAVSGGFILQATTTDHDVWRLGLTASKKTGNAVRRNRARRRLRALARIRLAPLAELGAPAQRECVASDGDRACWPIRAHLRRADPLRHAALIGLSDCLCGQAEQCNGKPKSLLHNGVKSSPISAAGALWVRRPTET